jgi:sortase A
MTRAARVMRRAAGAALAIGLAATGYVACEVAAARAFQTVERQRFEHLEYLGPEASAGPPADAPLEGESIGEVRLARLGLAVVVVQGESDAILRRAVGHLRDTALPGEPGNVVLAGHRDTFFRPLKDVLVGDVITMTTPRGDFEYIVESTAVVPPTQVEVLQPTAAPTMTLITCFPFSYVGPAPSRFIVRAREAGGRH